MPAAGPSTDGRLIYVPLQDGTVRALALEDGAPRWQASVATAWRTLPSAGGLLVLGAVELHALDATSGGTK
ncbi:MAG: PQQ-binding-like beta-propeller repeat protein, partial [Acidobacteria bacterium]|nr:PQQ-binding-like beta-propeller repeat protein [Acidobacteriota bacterium]